MCLQMSRFGLINIHVHTSLARRRNASTSILLVFISVYHQRAESSITVAAKLGCLHEFVCAHSPTVLQVCVCGCVRGWVVFLLLTIHSLIHNNDTYHTRIKHTHSRFTHFTLPTLNTSNQRAHIPMHAFALGSILLYNCGLYIVQQS